MEVNRNPQFVVLDHDIFLKMAESYIKNSDTPTAESDTFIRHVRRRNPHLHYGHALPYPDAPDWFRTSGQHTIASNQAAKATRNKLNRLIGSHLFRWIQIGVMDRYRKVKVLGVTTIRGAFYLRVVPEYPGADPETDSEWVIFNEKTFSEDVDKTNPSLVLTPENDAAWIIDGQFGGVGVYITTIPLGGDTHTLFARIECVPLTNKQKFDAYAEMIGDEVSRDPGRIGKRELIAILPNDMTATVNTVTALVDVDHQNPIPRGYGYRIGNLFLDETKGELTFSFLSEHSIDRGSLALLMSAETRAIRYPHPITKCEALPLCLTNTPSSPS